MQERVAVKIKTPFCWQHKPNLRAIRALAKDGVIKESDAANCLNVYRAITEYISDFGQDATLESNRGLVHHLARLSCLSQRLVSHCLSMLHEHGIIIYRQQRDQNGKFTNVYLELINLDERQNDERQLDSVVPDAGRKIIRKGSELLPCAENLHADEMASASGVSNAFQKKQEKILKASSLLPRAENMHADESAIRSEVSKVGCEEIRIQKELHPCAEKLHADESGFTSEVSKGGCEQTHIQRALSPRAENLRAVYKDTRARARARTRDNNNNNNNNNNNLEELNLEELNLELKDSKYHCAHARNSSRGKTKAPEDYRKPILEAWTDIHRDPSGKNVLTPSDYKVLNVAVEKLFADGIPLDDVLGTISDLGELIRAGEQWAKLATGNALPGLISRHRLGALKPKTKGDNSRQNMDILKRYLRYLQGGEHDGSGSSGNGAGPLSGGLPKR